MVNEGELANGFGGRRWDPGRIAPLGAAGAALAGPLVGGAYGVIRVGYENYYRGLGLTPEVVGLGQAAIVSRVGVAVGLLAVLLAAFAAFGVTIFRLARPLVDRSSQPGPWYVQGAWLGAPFLLLVAAVTASGVLMQRLLEPADLKFWIAGSLGAGMIGLQVCWLANVAGSLAGAPARVIRFVYLKGLPRVGWLVMFALIAGYVGIAVAHFWDRSTAAGRDVFRTGELSYEPLHVTVSPARVIPKTGDPLKVCSDFRSAVLVGRHGGTSFVLLRPTRDGDRATEVVPLLDGEYAVAVVSGRPQGCNPKAP
jgi:hypothetical protein